MKSATKFLLLAVSLLPFQVLSQSGFKELVRKNRFEEAIKLSQSVMSDSDSTSEAYGEALYYLGVSQLSLGQIDEASVTFSQGLSLPVAKNIPFFWKGLAMIQHEKLNYDSAINLYDKALGTTDESDPLYIQLLIDKGFLYQATEKYQGAGKMYYQAKQLYDRLDTDSPDLKLAIHMAIGDYQYHQGDYKNAEINLRLAMSIGEAHFHPSHPTMENLHSSLAHVYIGLEDKEKMRYHFEKVYQISKEGKAKGSFDLIIANNTMGMTLLNVPDYELALEYLIEAYDDVTTYFPDFHIGVHIVGMNLGIAHYKLKDYDKAKKYLHNSVEKGIKAHGGKAQTIAEALVYLAFSYEDSGDFQTALDIYEQALEANVLLKPGEKLSEYSEAVDVITTSFILENRATTYLKMYQESRDLELLKLAKEEAELNLRVLQKHQETLSHESRSSLSYELNYGYYIAADINWHLYQEKANELYLTNILNYIERNKSDYLRASLGVAETKSSSNIPEELLILESELQVEKEELRAKIIASENQGSGSQPWDSLSMVQTKIDSLSREIKKYIDPTYVYQWKELKDIQSQLGSDRAIMEFMFQEEVLIQMVVTENDVRVSRDSTKTLTDEVITFRNEIQSIKDKFTTRVALSDLALKNLDQLPSSVNKLTIIPDGPLHYLPFDLLGSGDDFLLERFDISYANFLKETESKEETNDKLLSYAPNFGSDQLASMDVVRSDLAAIPGAFEEVNLINTLFDGETLVSDLATETSFKEKANEYGLIHMATHAIVDDSDPEISRLVFNLAQDSLNDGYLHAYEIYNMELNAKLVTLSACNTGYGKIERGEGVMSLSWAFAYAGVPATVVSLWPASDKSTPELMKYFYQNLKEGQSKDVALNNARKQYLATAKGKARHPFYWGGFVLIGDNSPIEDDKPLLLWFSLGLISVLGVIFLLRRRKI